MFFAAILPLKFKLMFGNFPNHHIILGYGMTQLISVIIANYNSACFIEETVKSIIEQTHENIEIIIVDDISKDNSIDVIKKLQKKYTNIKLIINKKNGGPAFTRNNGFAKVKGDWVAIVDSDDIIHKDRFARLLSFAQMHEADIVADDLLHFYDDTNEINFLLEDKKFNEPFKVETAQYILSNSARSGLPVLGYLKPFFRRELLEKYTYNENLIIAEDYDFLLRMLLDGRSFWITPEPLYFYRKHSNSVSHRLSEGTVDKMISAQHQIIATRGDQSDKIKEAFAFREQSLIRDLQFQALINAIKRFKPFRALKFLISEPKLLFDLYVSASSGIYRRIKSIFAKSDFIIDYVNRVKIKRMRTILDTSGHKFDLATPETINFSDNYFLKAYLKLVNFVGIGKFKKQNGATKLFDYFRWSAEVRGIISLKDKN
jgi:succinoglycan biosynthesis protein ExoO